MIDRTEATLLMSAWLTNHPGDNAGDGPIELSLLEEQTLEMDFGWVFFYMSKLYPDTGDFKYAVAGNAPMIVDREDGSLHLTGTAHPVDYNVEEFRRMRTAE